MQEHVPYTYSELGLYIGAVVGSMYVWGRATFTSVEVEIPLVGIISLFNPIVKAPIALAGGAYFGGSWFDRIGQSLDAWTAPDLTKVNEQFLLRYVPWAMAMLSVCLLQFLHLFGGKSIFPAINQVEPAERYIITFLCGVYIGASLASRVGRGLNRLADNQHVGMLALKKMQRAGSALFNCCTERYANEEVQPVVANQRVPAL